MALQVVYRPLDGGHGMPIQTLLHETVSVPEAIVRVLEQAGIDLVFGMPGGRTGAIFDALYDHRNSIRACWSAKKAWPRSWPTCTAG